MMKKWLGLLMFFCNIQFAHASLIIPMYSTESGGSVGTIVADDTIYGLLLTPQLHGLSPGPHGFHVHQMPLCQDHGMAAGGHFDPVRTNSHRGPYRGDGHLGDLAILYVDINGQAKIPVLAPRLKLADIRDHALIIHENSDNYSDKPQKNGGGGPMMACGVIPFH